MTDEQRAFDWADRDPGPLPSSPLLRIAYLADRLRKLAERGIHIGTSSWKYSGWLGRVYEPERYRVRGKFSRTQFERHCLAEYAAVLPAVGADFSYYRFPSPETWHRLFRQVPEGFRFGIKVPQEITLERFPRLPRHGSRAGTLNPCFMDASLLRDKLLDVLEPYRSKLGVLILEFATIHEGPMREPRQFAAALDRLFSQLPLERFRFAVEVRNPEFLEDRRDYLACLKSHGVAHCLNSWTRMPSVADQLDMPGILTAEHVAARFLLRPGRTYRRAVDLFSPYREVKEPYHEGRSAMRTLIERCLANWQPLYVFVNNRFEGNAVETIDAVTEGLA